MTDKTTNTIEILPTVKENESSQNETDTIDLNLSEQLSKLFPHVQQQINEPDVGTHLKIDSMIKAIFYQKLTEVSYLRSLSFLQVVKMKNLKQRQNC